MATFSFPTSPSLNQTYTFQGKTWKYNGTGWALVTNVDIAQSAWNTANLAYINAGSADILAQSAYDNSNTKFSSSGGTITGPTTIAANVTISGNNNLTVTGNLNVLGYTTTSYTNSLTLSNAMFNLHTSNTLGPLTTNDGLNVGMAFHYYDTADKQAILVRENSTGYLIWYNTSTNLIGNTDSKGITMGTFQTDALIANTVLANGIELYAFTTSAYNSGNNTLTYATAGFNKANAANVLAQSAYDSGNSTLTFATAGFNKANAANVLAQSSYDFANTVNTYSFSAYSYANATNTLTVSAYNKANAANVLAQSAYDAGNSTNTLTVSSYNKANAANVLAQSAYDSGNNTYTYAQSGYTKANNAVQTSFVTVSANGNSITSSSNNDTLTITAATANGINVLNPSSKTIDFGLRTTGVVAGGYGNTTSIPSITVDAFGRVTSVSNNTIYVPPGTSIVANTGQLTANAATGIVALGLATTAVSAGNYGGSTQIPVLAIDAYGRITSASNTSVSTTISLAAGSGSGSVSGGGTLTVSGGTGITTSASGSTITITNSGVTSLTSNSTGRITQSSTTGAVSFDLATTAVTAATYNYSTIQVDAYGRITSASSGTPVTTFNTRSGAVTLSSSDVTSALTYTPANIAGDQFTGAVTVPSLKANTSVTVNTSAFYTSTAYTTSSVSQVTVDSFPTATYRSAKYFVQMTSSTSYHVIELNVLHDGTNPLLAQYGEIFTGSSLGTFDVSIVTGNLNLLFTPTNSATTVKLIRTNIVV
jgi:hypothetical protein